MNTGQMLAGLGFKQPPKKSGFPCPTIINSREPYTGSVGYVETKEETEAYIDNHKTVSERATTKRSPGNWE